MTAEQSIEFKLRNLTAIDLNRVTLNLDNGSWRFNGNDVPPETIVDGSTARFGSESINDLDGTAGFVIYEGIPGEVTIRWNVPFIGDNEIQVDVPPGFESDVVGDQASKQLNLKVLIEPPE